MRNNLVLSTGRDPWSLWTPLQQARAQWVAGRFAQMNRRSHLRGFHYWLVSQSPRPLWPDGIQYANDESSWEKMCAATVWARYLGAGDWSNLTDRKHPDALDNADYTTYNPDPTYEPVHYTVNDIRTQLLRGAPRFHTTGLSAYHLEIWIEKASMNEIILPPARRYGAVIQALVGEASLERATMSIARIINHRKPARIFYISDFDPAGQQMPVSVARKLEFYARYEGLDIRLRPLALTEAQVLQYKLPGIPTKASDSRAAGFIERFGDRATELDALEALHPGVLHRLVADTLAPYVDESKVRAIAAENLRLRTAYADFLSTLPLSDIADTLNSHAEEAHTYGTGMTDDFNYPRTDHYVDEDDNFLLDTTRPYQDQLRCYQEYRGK